MFLELLRHLQRAWLCADPRGATAWLPRFEAASPFRVSLLLPEPFEQYKNAAALFGKRANILPSVAGEFVLMLAMGFRTLLKLTYALPRTQHGWHHFVIPALLSAGRTVLSLENHKDAG